MKRVTIIGSGIAAIAAALEASQRGAHITLVKGRPGATSLVSGAWDIAADEVGLERLCGRSPLHPYAIVQKNPVSGPLETLISEGVEGIGRALSFPLHGSLRSPFLALTPLGTVKSTSFVHLPQSFGNLYDMQGARLLILGINGLPFFPSLAARLLEKINRQQPVPKLGEIKGLSVSMRGLPHAVTPVELAALLDDDNRTDAFQEAATSMAVKEGATHVALPPVIGIDRSTHILARLAETTGLKWFETLGLPPSLPGIRLQREIDRFLSKSGWTCLEGMAVGGVSRGRRITTLAIETGRGREETPVEHLILATGKFTGGGIQDLREPILDLPLFADGQPVRGKSPSSLTGSNFFSDHSLWSVGLRTNQDLQPVDARGTLLFDNLWAAGALLGGYDAVREGCGMGVPLATGILAGRLATLS